MILKKHIQNRKLILAVCDNDLIGKKFEEGNLQLDLTVEFYNGKNTTEDELEVQIRKAYIINAIGKDAIDYLKKINLISEKNVIKISGIPSTQILLGHEF